MRRLAGIGLSTSAIFLAVVAVMLNSPSLFYMGTALVATIAACRLQAWLSVRGLKFERIAPGSVVAGEEVTVEITVWSDRRIRRPLISVWDMLPPRLVYQNRTPSLPIAPAYDMGIRTHYSFRPLKRGKYRWSGIRVIGTDALGLVRMDKDYKTDAAELTVLPTPIPVSVDLTTSSGWGISEAESGQSRGAGIEPRGVREYHTGDSLRHVHWRSSARAGQLLVKEFEAGSNSSVAFLIQSTAGTEIGEGLQSSFELMCGHVAYLAEQLLHMGSRVDLPLLEQQSQWRGNEHDRLNDIYEALASANPDRRQMVSDDLAEAARELPPGSTVFMLMVAADPGLPHAASQLGGGLRITPLIYRAEDFQLSRGQAVIPASESGYLDQLQSHGAAPILMPGFGSITT